MSRPQRVRTFLFFTTGVLVLSFLPGLLAFGVREGSSGPSGVFGVRTLFDPALAFAQTGSPTPGPTVATEDTMHTEVPEVLVRAPRITLDEILDRVARGEARREASIVDQQLTATFRMVRGVLGSKSGPELLSERVVRVYKKRPNLVRTVVLREYSRERQRNATVQMNFRGGMDEEIVNFAFRADARRSYRYRIVGRDVIGNHLVYRIAFQPRSPLDPTSPSGTVWVDTNEFVIVRQEIGFRRSPVPMFVKDVKRMVIERRKFGDHWVLHRVLMRVESAIPLPRVGKGFDIALRFDDYRMNTGLTEAFFAGKGR